MFDHLVEKNRLLPFFEQVGLDSNDLIFIKELIHVQLNEQKMNQVRNESLDCRKTNGLLFR